MYEEDKIPLFFGLFRRKELLLRGVLQTILCVCMCIYIYVNIEGPFAEESQYMEEEKSMGWLRLVGSLYL